MKMRVIKHTDEAKTLIERELSPAFPTSVGIEYGNVGVVPQLESYALPSRNEVALQSRSSPGKE